MEKSMTTFSSRVFFTGFVLWTLLIPQEMPGQIIRKQAGVIPQDLMEIIMNLPAYIDPTLPAPRLVTEPPFTLGTDNTVYWYGDSVRTWLGDRGMRLLFFEIEASYDDTLLWAPIPANADSALFTDMPMGIRIHYRLRYFARDSLDQYLMSYWSEETWSIQDNNPPILYSVEILDLQESDDIAWVIGQTIQMRVQASDPRGQVMEIVIQETSASVDDTLYHPIEPPSDTVNTIIPYTFRSPAHVPIMLSVWVIDVSGQDIGKYTQTLFWWPEEEAREQMVCFPNPFNPDLDNVITIRVDDPGVQEAKIFDPFGNLVQVLQKTADSNIFFEWDGRNGRGDRVSTGGYICVAVGNTRRYCKIAVIR
jgi:hypothetical protein